MVKISPTIFNVEPDLKYEIASATDGNDIIVSNLITSPYIEYNPPVIARSIDRYIRSVRAGVPSGWTSANLNTLAPVAPTLTKD